MGPAPIVRAYWQVPQTKMPDTLAVLPVGPVAVNWDVHVWLQRTLKLPV